MRTRVQTGLVMRLLLMYMKYLHLDEKENTVHATTAVALPQTA